MDDSVRNFEAERHLVNEAIKVFFERKMLEADDVERQLLAVIKDLILRGGKRLRPILTIAAYKAWRTDIAKIIPIAIAQELLHAFLLIHDDIIDDDLQRHGGPNIAGSYLQKLGKNGRQVANSYALLAGDLCFTLANQLIATSPFDHNLKNSALNLIQETMRTTIRGQLQELDREAKPVDQVSADNILEIYANKTAYYSFVTPLQTGASLGGASPKQIEQVVSWGRPLGIAFQIQDDLDELNDDWALKDLRQGRLNLVIKLGLEMSTGDEHRLIRDALGNPKVTARAAKKVCLVLRSCGAQAETQKTKNKLLNEASRHLRISDFKPDFKQSLSGLIKTLTG